MSTRVWDFKTRNFTVVCEEEEPDFVDSLVHSREVLDALEHRGGWLTHMRARVHWRGVEVGYAFLGDCIFLYDDDGYTLISDYSYRYEVARRAISNARTSLAEMTSVPGSYLRKIG